MFILLIFITVIILYIAAIKTKARILWNLLFIIQIVLILLCTVIMAYFDHSPGHGIFPGLAYAKEVFTCLLLTGLLIVTTLISAITKIIIFERDLKKSGQTHFNPLYLILAVFLVAYGYLYVAHDINSNWGKRSVEASVVKIERYQSDYTLPESTLKTVTFEFEVDKQTYTDTIIGVREGKYTQGEKVKMYYTKLNSEATEYALSSISNSSNTYLPPFILAAVLFGLRIFIYYRNKKSQLQKTNLEGNTIC